MRTKSIFYMITAGILMALFFLSKNKLKYASKIIKELTKNLDDKIKHIDNQVAKLEEKKKATTVNIKKVEQKISKLKQEKNDAKKTIKSMSNVDALEWANNRFGKTV